MLNNIFVRILQFLVQVNHTLIIFVGLKNIIKHQFTLTEYGLRLFVLIKFKLISIFLCYNNFNFFFFVLNT